MNKKLVYVAVLSHFVAAITADSREFPKNNFLKR